jgi:hypothetical protein
MSENSFEFDLRYQEPELRRAAWVLFKRVWHPYLPWKLPLESVGCIALVWVMGRFWPRDFPYLIFVSVASLVGAAVLGSLIYFPWAFLNYRRALLRLWVDKALRVRMTPAEISISSDTETRAVAWASISGAERGAHDLFLHIGPRKGILLPRELVPLAALRFAEERVGAATPG